MSRVTGNSGCKIHLRSMNSGILKREDLLSVSDCPD